MKLQNKVSIATGTTSGISQEIAQTFIGESEKIIAADLGEARGRCCCGRNPLDGGSRHEHSR